MPAETKPLTKTCKRCGAERPLKDFAVNANATDGRNSVCVDCRGKKTPVDVGNVELVESMYAVYSTGDKQKDPIIRQLCDLAVNGRMEPSRLKALEMLVELNGIGSAKPQSEADLISFTKERLRKQLESTRS